MAAQMLDGLEQRGKQVTPGNVAYYTILHLKSGRRSYSGGRTDVMGSSTQLDHSAMVLSLEEEVGYGHMRVVKERMAEELREYLGDQAIADALRVPGWKGNILVDKEKMACRADRRRR